MTGIDEKGGDTPRCPHCGGMLVRWRNPEMTSWGEGWQWVCFNDQCTYYVEGWSWMATQYNVHASYRFRLDPKSGDRGPLPVWSPDALKNGIVDLCQGDEDD